VSRAVGALAAVALLACQSVAPVDPGTPIGLDDGRARALIAAHRARIEQRDSLRAAARLAIEAPGITLSRPQRLVVRRPASLRIEILGLFDQVVGAVATDGRRYAFVDLASGARDAGPVDDALLWRTARIDLTPSDAVALLLGLPRLDPGARVVEARRFRDGGVGVATRDGGIGRTRWHEWDAAGRLRSAALREHDGRPVWVARFSDWRSLGDEPFAHDVELDFPRVQAEARVRFQAVELDPELAAGVFVLHIPPGG
jgi:hypothetical protein